MPYVHRRAACATTPGNADPQIGSMEIQSNTPGWRLAFPEERKNTGEPPVPLFNIVFFVRGCMLTAKKGTEHEKRLYAWGRSGNGGEAVHGR